MFRSPEGITHKIPLNYHFPMVFPMVSLWPYGFPMLVIPPVTCHATDMKSSSATSPHAGTDSERKGKGLAAIRWVQLDMCICV